MDEQHLSMSDRLLRPLDKFESSLNALVQSLTSTTTYAGVPAATDGLIAADGELTEALLALRSHQDTYQKVLRLRAQKAALENKLKDTICECERFRSESRTIDPRITDISDDEDEEQLAELKPVDYEQLLAFAGRIGRTNTTAYQEASKEAQEREEAARLKREEERKQRLGDQKPRINGVGTYAGANAINGLNGVNGHASNNAEDQPDPTQVADTQIIETETARDRIRRARAEGDWAQYHGSIPWPMVDDIRKGRLGELQSHFEGHSGDTDELLAHVKKLVSDDEVKKQSPGPDTERPEQKLQQQPARSQQPQAPKRKVLLDLPEEDSDDDD